MLWFFLSLFKHSFSVSLPVFVINNFSVNSCDFDVLMGGGELWVFIHHRLG